MKYLILPIIFCGALIAAFISKRTIRPLKDFLIETASYFFLFYGLFSFGKAFLGRPHYTLLECFSTANIRTLIIYSSAMLLFTIVIVIFRKKFHRFLTKNFLFWFLPMITCAYALVDSITNLMFCIFIALAIVCDFLFSSKAILSDIPPKNRVHVLAFVVLFFSMTYLLFVPSNVILLNLQEISTKYSWLLSASLIYFTCGTLILFFIGFLLPTFFTELYIILLFSMTLASYIQSNFLNGRLSLMDGTAQAFSATKIALNLIIWIFIITAMIVLLFCKKEVALKLTQYISILFFGTQLIAMIVLWLTTDYSVQQTKTTLTREYITTFEEKDNVLVIVLDWFDKQIMDEIEAQEPDFLAPLKDFTDYTNATSCYAFTYMSIPYMLSGLKWSDGMDEAAYISYANENGVFLSKLAEMNCNIQIYTDPSIIHEELGKYIQNYSSNVTYKYNLSAFRDFWSKCARYSLLPFAVKQNYMYTNTTLNRVQRKYDDALVYEDITEQGIIIDANSNGQFKMIHLTGAHPPYTMSSNYIYVEDGSVSRNEQAKASFNIAYEYIDRLKKANIYDDTTIIITADHGRNTFNNNILKLEQEGLHPISAPILFVKNADETHDTMIRSSAPVSHEDFIPTVLKALGDPSYSQWGRSFDEISESENRTRYFIYGRTPDIPYVKYIINGNVMDEDSWTLEEIE